MNLTGRRITTQSIKAYDGDDGYITTSSKVKCNKDLEVDGTLKSNNIEFGNNKFTFINNDMPTQTLDILWDEVGADYSLLYSDEPYGVRIWNSGASLGYFDTGDFSPNYGIVIQDNEIRLQYDGQTALEVSNAQSIKCYWDLETIGNVSTDTATFNTWKYKYSTGSTTNVMSFDGTKITSSFEINCGTVRCTSLYAGSTLGGYTLTLGNTTIGEYQLKKLLALIPAS